jgi:phage tail tape-measure protein
MESGRCRLQCHWRIVAGFNRLVPSESQGPLKGGKDVNAEQWKSSTEAESVGAGATGGAALGAVIALGVTAGSSVIFPIAGALVGATVGGTAGHYINTLWGKRR